MASGTDFNDLAGQQGLRPVKAAIDRAIDAARGIPYGRYRVTATAVMMQTETTDGDAEERPLCTRLAPVGIARSAAGNSYALVTEMTDLDHTTKPLILPAELIYRSGGEEARLLFVDQGGAFAPGTREKSEFHDLLKSFLRAADNLPRITLADRCGWITRGAAAAYVLPAATIGQLGTEQVRLLDPGDGAPDYSVSGTLHDWQQHIGRYCCGNSRLLLACAVPLAGALLHPAGGEGGDR
ncbi:MAG: DUF927 domain-containing protein, partial [Desulfuromonas thiophila]|nr:DUF927 domain-containing protein [Desulfuromonas thiophila]